MAKWYKWTNITTHVVDKHEQKECTILPKQACALRHKSYAFIYQFNWFQWMGPLNLQLASYNFIWVHNESHMAANKGPYKFIIYDAISFPDDSYILPYGFIVS